MVGPAHARDVCKGLVDGVFFHLGGEAPYDVEHPPGKEAVGLIVGWEDDKPRAEGSCLMEGDTALNPQPFCGIAGAGDNPPLSPRDDGLPFKLRVNGLLTGCKEGVPIDMDNGLGP